MDNLQEEFTEYCSTLWDINTTANDELSRISRSTSQRHYVQDNWSREKSIDVNFNYFLESELI